MALRLPLTTVLDYNDAGNVGATSLVGGVAKQFFIPQDTDNVVVKLTASITGGTGITATLQTTDDGGTTWYDTARSALALLTPNDTAVFLSVPAVGMGIKSSNVATSVMGSTGSAAASTLGVGTVSGLPLLSTNARVFLQYAGNVTANNLARVKVMVNQQSGKN